MAKKRAANEVEGNAPEVEEKRPRTEPEAEAEIETPVSVPGSPLASRILNAYKNGSLSAIIGKSVRRAKGKSEFEPWTGTQLSDTERVTVRFLIDDTPVSWSGEFGACTYIYGAQTVVAAVS